MSIVKIPKEYAGKKNLVAIPERRLQELLTIERELTETVEIIQAGEAEHRAGKTIRIETLSDLLD